MMSVMMMACLAAAPASFIGSPDAGYRLSGEKAATVNNVDVQLGAPTCDYNVPTAGINGVLVSENVTVDGGAEKHTICVKSGAVVLTVVPPKLPPSRLRLSLASMRGEHVVAEWDPLVSTRLARKVVLPAGMWLVSWRSDAIRHASKTQQDFAWQDGDGFPKGPVLTLTPELFVSEAKDSRVPAARNATEYGLRGSNVDEKGAEQLTKVEDLKVSFSVERLPSVTRALDVFTRKEGGGFGGTKTVGRGFGLDGAAAADVAQQVATVVGEIIVDRAKTRALKNAVEGLREELKCGKDDKGKPQEFEKADWLHLPRTCSVLATTGLDSLAAGLDTLRRAVQADLLESLARQPLTASTWRLQSFHEVATRDLVAIVADSVERGRVEAQAAEAILATLTDAVRVGWDAHGQKEYPLQQDSLDEEELATAIIGVVFATAGQCYALDDCDARQLAEMLKQPERYFFFGKVSKERLAALREYLGAWPEALPTAQRIVRVMNGAEKPNDALIEVALVAGETEVFLRCMKPKDAGFPGASSLRGCVRDASVENQRALMRALRAALDQDGASAVAALMALVGQAAPELTQSRVWRAASAGLGAWSSSLPADNQDAESKRTATKAAANAAIDALTDHHERVGVVVSLQGAVRLVGGYQGDPAQPNYGGPSIPLGMALEVPRFSSHGFWHNFGFHLDVSVIDLARVLQFGAIDQAAAPQTAGVDLKKWLWPQVSAGLLFFGGWVFAGVTVAYQPTTNAASFGGALGFEVPLLDFN